jgi:WhiB family redox-sensing transcriptional regulator
MTARRIPFESPEWHTEAACLGVDVHVFFPPNGTSHDPALAYCRRCSVRVECLNDALIRPDGDCGIRGGMNERERRREMRRRRRTLEMAVSV